jgi:hypothetical protein
MFFEDTENLNLVWLEHLAFLCKKVDRSSSGLENCQVENIKYFFN